MKIAAVSKFLRFRKSWKQTVQEIEDALMLGGHALVDSTGVGDPIVEKLQETSSAVEGYHFTSASKQKLMEGLAVGISRQDVSYPQGSIPIELDQFEYEYTAHGVRYSAPEGMHDDCVCALALALSAYSNSYRFRLRPVM